MFTIHTFRRRLMVTCLVCLCLASGSLWVNAEDAVPALVPFLPESANVIAVIRVQEVLNSPRGKAEDWAEEQQGRFLAGASSVPAGVDTLVVGMHVRPQTPETVSSVGLAFVPQGVQLAAIAQREDDASVETLGGRPSVHSKFNAYYVELSKTVLGIVSPAARQEAARYVRQVALPNGPAVVNYLNTVSKLQHQILIAMDLKDMANPDRIQQDLDQIEGLRGNAAAREELSKLLASIEGVRFCADVDDTTQATLSVDFANAPGPSSLMLKGMILRIISDAGLHVGELENATPAVQGNSLVLTMDKFSDPSLRLVLSLITTSAPVPDNSAAPTVDNTGSTSQPSRSSPAKFSSVPAEANASLRYFKTVNQCLDDLEQANKRNRDPGQNATWHENIARKIEKLATRGVDAELVEYGAHMSKDLRGLSASLRGVAVEVDIVQRTLVWNSSYDPGYTQANVWGGFGYQAPSVRYDSNLQQVRERQAEAVIRGEKLREQTWQMIHEERSEMSEKVRSRYEKR